MITALISSGLGIFGGLVPDLFREFRESREHFREIERLDKQAELQIRLLDHRTDAKLAEIEGNVYVEEMRAFRTQMSEIYRQQAPIGIGWVDSWNAALRPFACSLIIVLFVVVAAAFVWGVIADTNFAQGDSLVRAAKVIWTSLVGEAIQAVLGYLFGYRSAAKVRDRVRR
jgi:hypothetical protein